jgi:hypothetical protein
MSDGKSKAAWYDARRQVAKGLADLAASLVRVAHEQVRQERLAALFRDLRRRGVLTRAELDGVPKLLDRATWEAHRVEVSLEGLREAVGLGAVPKNPRPTSANGHQTVAGVR